MRVILLGGGSGGHFYPLVAVARALRDIAEEERIIFLELVLMGDAPFDPNALMEENISFEHVPAGKLRRYFSIKNFSDTIKTLRGIVRAFWRFTLKPPDVVFSKGGYDSFPVLWAARIYRIPVMIHESDAVPGMVTKWAAKFAKRIGVSFPETVKLFPAEKTALVGNPIRQGLLGGSQDEAFDLFDLESGVPIVLVLGGSQGAQKINDALLAMLAEAVEKVQIIHVTGPLNETTVKNEAEVVLAKSQHKKRYHAFGALNVPQLRNASFVSDVVVSRAGGSAIFEFAAWRVPTILIPITDSAQDHQRENAYNYARTGAAEVVEEANLTPHLLLAEIEKVITDEKRRAEMKQAAGAFARIDAARKIANELVRLGIHE
ncbi:MAG: UDP-N-acetylglucosamine--N-acetylmuramyl-(pentapeptide) pyrophosphoryl-undecaprenol N-acetylglucosamine transferase [Candidatus Ryanbacteria bacterium]|nr:UDP-N-acetylglucosamine--N-acetylmuramyl-(pentapeptide) pyrophosphoryl-undecaprenol N-acetylglucosamine transferase [Candidatus Ryanbacteria bacterium]